MSNQAVASASNTAKSPSFFEKIKVCLFLFIFLGFNSIFGFGNSVSLIKN